MASNQNRNSQQRSSSKGMNGTFLGCVFLGICILISGLNIGGNVKKLSTAINDKNFSDTNTFTAPSEISFGASRYLDEQEAAAYLKLSEDEFLKLIRSGDITEYVKTSTGYSVSVEVLDEWFDNAAYQNKLNTVDTDVASE